MSITQHHLLDAHRAWQHGEAPPPAPGTHDQKVVLDWREYRRFRTVVAGRPAHGRIRQALGRRLRPRARSTS
ncbi:hypothetical protein [Streptomyces sp. AS02]|uniref:hypothetical protein n=1 Tax=Streptomyces sp. AS02 TaxID=2938946 RepID=UPI002021C717|nr:hypothetical protein [Streptomyces sp. AS02]MCL8013730.1 hypothetical protein [Streptomyces sp. AS02]